MVNTGTLLKVLTILVTTGLAILFSLVLLESDKAAIAVYVLTLGVLIVFVEPFIGLLNYFIFLYVRPQEFIPGFVGLPVMLLLGTMTFGFMLIHMAVKRRVLGFGPAPQTALMVWFLIAIGVSNLAHFNMSATKDSVREFMSPFLMYLMVVVLVSSEKKIKITLSLLVLLTVFLAGQGIYQYFTGVGIAGQTKFQGRIVSIGIFADPNDLALALLMMLPLCFAEMAASRNMLYRFVMLVFASSLAVTVFMTDSRGGILSLGMLFMIAVWRRFGWKVGIATGVVAFLGIFVLGPSRMGTISTTEDSASARIDSWSVGINLLQSFPLFGVGAQHFLDYHPKTAHNSWLLCAAELGLFGYIPWLLMIYLSIKNLYYISKNAAASRHGLIGRYADGVMLGLIAFMLAATFLSRTYIEPLYILIGMSAAITTVFVQRDGRRFQLISKRDLAMGGVLAIGSVVVFKMFVMWAWL